MKHFASSVREFYRERNALYSVLAFFGKDVGWQCSTTRIS